ncbi:hypothetical protein KSP40_PGU011275 [Platanthera guangdongensis]|uniref:Uncharacterized protein n=1 Tax=Platanthera guangdongensis TaxID=2320717 RepID=A0ABR2LCI8_9ASPA
MTRLREYTPLMLRIYPRQPEVRRSEDCSPSLCWLALYLIYCTESAHRIENIAAFFP